MFKDYEKMDEILKAKEPKDAMNLGKNVKGFSHDIWTERMFQVTLEGNYAKFDQNEVLADALVATEDAHIVYASPRDKVWGVGLSCDDPQIYEERNWQGTNRLGKVLMKVRDEIQTNRKYTKRIWRH